MWRGSGDVLWSQKASESATQITGISIKWTDQEGKKDNNFLQKLWTFLKGKNCLKWHWLPFPQSHVGGRRGIPLTSSILSSLCCCLSLANEAWIALNREHEKNQISNLWGEMKKWEFLWIVQLIPTSGFYFAEYWRPQQGYFLLLSLCTGRKNASAEAASAPWAEVDLGFRRLGWERSCLRVYFG